MAATDREEPIDGGVGLSPAPRGGTCGKHERSARNAGQPWAMALVLRSTRKLMRASSSSLRCTAER
jgi:hypothetical protein